MILVLPFQVIVHNPSEVPDVTAAFLMNTYADERMSLSVSYIGSVTSSGVNSLSPERRKCQFADEYFPNLPFSAEVPLVYQQHTCIVACRNQEILHQCGCVPYYTSFSLSHDYGNSYIVWPTKRVKSLTSCVPLSVAQMSGVPAERSTRMRNQA